MEYQEEFYHEPHEPTRTTDKISYINFVMVRDGLWLILFLFIFPFSLAAQYFTMPPLVSEINDVPEIVSRAAVLIDASTGALLYSKNADDEIPPASLTKLMSMFIIMNEIKEGRASYDELIPITIESWAQSMPPQSSLMFLEPGQNVTLREIMLGLSVPSGNDAAVAAALRFAPDIGAFADLMTLQARRMGLNVTSFVDVSGYSNMNNTTAEEFAYFCKEYIRLHPESLADFHSVISFSYPLIDNVSERNRNNVRTITQESNNRLLLSFPGVDGLKTGFIPDAGYNIALTAERDNTRFILVILGAPSQPGGARIRLEDGARLLNWAFDNFKTIRVGDSWQSTLDSGKWKVVREKGEGRREEGVVSSEQLTRNREQGGELFFRARLWKGRQRFARLKLADTADFTSPVDRGEKLFYRIDVSGNLVAPVSVNTVAGFLVISDEYGELHRAPFVTERAYERGGFIKRIWHSFLLLFR